MKKILVLACIILLCSTHALAQKKAKELTVDDHKVKVKYKQSGNTLLAEGWVNGGHACNKLKVDIFLKNKATRVTTQVKAVIENYNGSNKQSFKSSESTHSRKRDRDNWYVRDVELKCMK